MEVEGIKPEEAGQSVAGDEQERWSTTAIESTQSRLQAYAEIFKVAVQIGDAKLLDHTCHALTETHVESGEAVNLVIDTISQSFEADCFTVDRFGTEDTKAAIAAVIALSQLCSWTGQTEKALAGFSAALGESSGQANSREFIEVAYKCVADLYESCTDAKLAEILYSGSEAPAWRTELQIEVFTEYLSLNACTEDLLSFMLAKAISNADWAEDVQRRFEELGHRAALILPRLRDEIEAAEGNAMTAVKLAGAIGPEAVTLAESILSFGGKSDEPQATIETALGKIGGVPLVGRYKALFR